MEIISTNFEKALEIPYKFSYNGGETLMENYYKKAKGKLKGVFRVMAVIIPKKEPTTSVLSTRQYPKSFSVQFLGCGKSLMSLAKYDSDDGDVFNGEEPTDKED